MKQVIISKELHPLFQSTLQFLNRSEISILPRETSDDMLKRHFEHHADLIILKIDQPGMACETMINVIRRSESLRAVSILVCHENLPAPRERSVRCGANAVIALPATSSRLAAAVQQLLDVQPRRSYRVVMNVSVESMHNNKSFLCKMENISAHGMLLRTSETLAPGNRISCSFYLPDGTRVVADGEIKRTVGQSSASPAKEYGIRFLSISPAAQTAIAAFVQKEKKVSGSAKDAGDFLVA